MRFFWLVTVIVGFGACNTTSQSHPADDMALRDGGLVDQAASEPLDAAGGLGYRAGSVAITATTMVSSASAGFIDAPAAKPPTSSSSTYGACTLTVVSGLFVPPSTGYKSAGTVTISGGTQAVTLTSTAPSSSAPTGYNVFSSSTSVWHPGDVLTITAVGADVPAFMGSATVPSPVTITQPAAPSAGAMLTVDRSQDLSFVWTGGGSGSVRATLLVEPKTSGSSGGIYSLMCDFATSAGTGRMPKAALMMLPTGETTTLAFSGGSPQSVTAGSYTVQLIVQTLASWSGSTAPLAAVNLK